jgi:hypothetical protein
VLAHKSILLDAVVSTHITFDVVEISKLLGTKRCNLECAIEWCCFLQTLGAFQWAISHQKKRFDGLSKETKVAIHLWWTSETRVSPNKKKLCTSTLVQNTMKNMQHIFC